MFVFNSSCSSNHGNDPISFPDHPFHSHFSSPFDDDVALLLQQPQQQHFDILLHQQQQHQPLNEEAPSTRNMSDYDVVHQQNYLIMEQQQIIQRKRGSSKRDRHSKINTLRGPRDRRMRLSLPVAREFFGLQDMLGVDKASKTVEWLLFQARHAIKKLSLDHQSGGGDTRSSPSSMISDGEVVSGIDETTVNTSSNTKEEGRKVTKKEKRGRGARKTTLFHPLARECRDRARARARARTWEKQLQNRQKIMLSSSSDANYPIKQIEGTNQDVSKMSSSWSTRMETGEESAGTTHQIIDQQLRITRDPGRIIDNDPDDDCLMIMGGRWSPSNSIYNGSPQEHQLGDFQFLAKPWEPYNNHGIC